MLETVKSFLADKSGQMGGMDLPGAMILLVVAGVIGFVGLQVMSTVIDTSSLQSGDPLYNASEALETSVNDAWGLVGVSVRLSARRGGRRGTR